MKTTFTIVALAALSIAGAAQAAPTTAESGAGAKIIAPLQIDNTSALYFGTVAPSLTEADVVVVSPNGDKKCGAALTCLTADHTAAAFDVKGEPDAVYTISLPSAVEMANENGDEMTVIDFISSKDSGRLVKGEDSFTVGGTLDVDARQPAGKYTGRFVVAVEYQ
jgi:hypothetical protein